MKSDSPIGRDQLFSLFGAVSDGTITEAEAAQLAAALTSSAETRKLWFLHQDMELGLDEWAAARSQTSETALNRALARPATPARPARLVALPKPSLRRPASRPLLRFAIAASIVAAAGIALWSAARPPAGFATLTRSASAHWENTRLEPGTPLLPPQSLDLHSGIVELSMSSGARVVFEGPGRMEILSENSIRLHSGRVHATVPPSAKGFTVDGNGFSVVDHGTEFGCAAPKSATPEVHVFSGEVELKPWNRDARYLHGNQALAIKTDSLEPIATRPELFVSPADLDALAANPTALRSQASRMLANHPAAVLYLDPADTTGNKLPNTARTTSPTPPATLHHCTLTDGRDPTRKAIAFDGKSSHISLRLDHQSTALTLIAWMRCPTPRLRQDLVSASAPLSPGAIAWYRHQSDSIGFGAHTPVPNMPGRGWRMLHSAPLPDHLTDWSLVATVVDAKAGSIIHFLNGKVVGMGQISLPPTLHLGPLNLGATKLDPNSETLVHHFHGDIDELAIIAAPLTAAEITRLYQLGRPGLQQPSF